MCRSSEGRAARGGFVLLEAMIALAIIGLFAIALLQATGTQIRAARQARTLLVARSLAEDRLAALQLLSYDALEDPPDSLLDGTFPEPFQDYSWTAEVAPIDSEYDLFGAEVVVRGAGETFPLRTLIHAPEPVVQVNGQGSAGGGIFTTGGRGGGRGGRAGGQGGRGGRSGQGGTGGRGGRGGGRGGQRGGQAGQGGRRGATGGRSGSQQSQAQTQAHAQWDAPQPPPLALATAHTLAAPPVP